MIYAFTGQPAAGKTSGAISMLMNDKAFQHRKVYVIGVNKLNKPEWTIITEEQFLKWWEFEDGCIFLVDEAQDYFRTRRQGSEVPEHIKQLEKHRKRGMDFVLTFQDGRQVDTSLRILINHHYHSHRLRGSKIRTIYKYDYFELNPIKNTKTASISTETLPKDAFDKYESASLHTETVKVPKTVWFLAAALIFLSYSVFKVYKSFTRDRSFTEQSPSTETSSPIPSTPKGTPDYTVEYFINQHRPLIKGDPRSAPVYRQLLTAKSLPRLNCIMTNALIKGRQQCRCYTQQSTRIKSIDEEQCKYYVSNGYEFDYTLEESNSSTTRLARLPDSDESNAPFDLVERDTAPRITQINQPVSIPHPALR